MDITKHNIEIKNEEQDGVKHQYTLLDGKPFGTETFISGNEVSVAFYQQDGLPMNRSPISTITYTTAKQEQQKNMLLAQKIMSFKEK